MRYRLKLAVLVVAGMGAVFVTAAFDAPAVSAANRSCSSSTSLAKRPTIRYRDTGTCVKDMQKRLIAKGYSVGKAGADGDYGSITLGAVKRFQKDNQLYVDGVVGPKTWAALLAKKSAPKPATSSYNKYKCGNAGQKVFLVYDDYPTSTASFKKLISTAKSNNIGIGVAPNGKHVKSGLVPVDYARDRGMLVVDHTYSHKNLTKLSRAQITWEITQPYIGSNYVRPPYGAENATVRSVLAEHGKYDCLWTLDPRDWDGKSPRAAADYIIKNAQKGSTVVVHLNHMGKDASLLPYMKSGLKKRGIDLCPPWDKATTKKMPAVYCK